MKSDSTARSVFNRNSAFEKIACRIRIAQFRKRCKALAVKGSFRSGQTAKARSGYRVQSPLAKGHGRQNLRISLLLDGSDLRRGRSRQFDAPPVSIGPPERQVP